MENLTIIVSIAVLAFVLMKIRDYTKSAIELKKAKQSFQKAESMKTEYRQKIAAIAKQKADVANEIKRLQKLPKTHDTIHKIKKNKRLLAKLVNQYDDFSSASRKFAQILDSTRNQDGLTQALRCYLHSKSRF